MTSASMVASPELAPVPDDVDDEAAATAASTSASVVGGGGSGDRRLLIPPGVDVRETSSGDGGLEAVGETRSDDDDAVGGGLWGTSGWVVGVDEREGRAAVIVGCTVASLVAPVRLNPERESEEEDGGKGLARTAHRCRPAVLLGSLEADCMDFLSYTLHMPPNSHARSP